MMSNKDKPTPSSPSMAEEFSDLLWGKREKNAESLSTTEARPAEPKEIRIEDQTLLPIPTKDNSGHITGYNLQEISRCTGQEFVAWCRDVLPIPGYPGIDISFFDDLIHRQKAFDSIVEICSQKFFSDKIIKERFIN